MESDSHYYWRRAQQELQAAQRAVTPAAAQRRRELAQVFLGKLALLESAEERAERDLALN